jgi:hypothetical protein
MTDKELLKHYRARKRELVAQYGRRGEKHPAARMIGGINAAAQEIHVLTGKINSLSKPTGPQPTVTPLIDGITPRSKRLPGGHLLFEVRFGSNAVKVGRALGGGNLFYLVVGDRVQDGYYQTAGQAIKRAKVEVMR